MGVRVRFWKGAWWVFITYRGARKAKRVGDRRAAEIVASQLRARLQLGDLSMLEAEPDARATHPEPTLQEYAERWLAAYAPNIKPRTADLYRALNERHIFPALGMIRLGTLTREQVRQFFADKVAGGMKRVTALKVVALVREILNHAIEDALIVTNPAARPGRFYRGRTEEEATPRLAPVTAQEVGLLLATCQRWYPEALDLITMAVWTGMRQGELFGLQWPDLDFAGHFAEVRRTVFYTGARLLAGSPKSGRTRRVDVPGRLLTRLQVTKSVREAEAVVEGREPVGWVFPNGQGNPLDANNFNHRLWRPLLEKAKLRRIRFHDLRHTYASLLIAQGESLAYVKDQLGHSSIKITVDLYGHLVPGANRGAVERLADATTRNPHATEVKQTVEEQEASGEKYWSRGRELNPRPTDYESVALPLSYPGFSSGYVVARARF